ncbi:hypothetical protein HPB50_006969 [Hyalomma asiaticum]|uniref:Uncharacterized protein n=1 Tax=Hyalomma asiaticum TaxID=266040 RepID=A0ACB7TG11_HYAAI|nr:hypothetical protein HPB50_006969 [Hyalomma asiaticum]
MQTEEFGEESGWCEVRRGAKTRCSDEARLARNNQQGRSFVEAATNKWKNARNVRQIIRASRLPNLPKEDYRVIVRPRGGFNVSNYKLYRIYYCLRNAAGVDQLTGDKKCKARYKVPYLDRRRRWERRRRLWTLQVQAQIPDQIKVEAAVRFENCSRRRQEENTGELGKRGFRHCYSIA